MALNFLKMAEPQGIAQRIPLADQKSIDRLESNTSLKYSNLKVQSEDYIRF